MARRRLVFVGLGIAVLVVVIGCCYGFFRSPTTNNNEDPAPVVTTVEPQWTEPTEVTTEPSLEPTTTQPTVKPTTTQPTVKPTTKRPTVKAVPEKTYEEPPAEAYYPNCAAVRAAGAAPLHRYDPGYTRKLDRDGDGIACER